MSEEDESQKTEEPTTKKLSQAREKGQVAQSQEIKNWLILLAGMGALVFLGPFMANNIRRTVLPFIERPEALTVDFNLMPVLLLEMAKEIGLIMFPILLLLFVVAVISNIVQFGFLFSPNKIQPDIAKISLLKGAKRMFSSKALMEFLKGILKLLAVSFVAFSMALPMLHDITLIPSMSLELSLERINDIALLLMVGTVAVMTVVAVLDFTFQKYTHTKEMRMSKQEVKDETKQSEGDPLIKARIRKVRMERAQQRMMAAVPAADVIITNPTHYSIALEYKMDEMRAPKLVAKGIDHLAMRIREVAQANDIPLVENAPLARTLYANVELDEEIPAEHFKAVAEVIGFIMRKRGDLAPAAGSPQMQ